MDTVAPIRRFAARRGRRPAPDLPQGRRQRSPRARRRLARLARQRNRRAARPVGVREIHAVAHHRRLDACHCWKGEDRGPAGQRCCRPGRDGISDLRAFPLAHGARECRTRTRGAGPGTGGAPQAGARRHRSHRSRRVRKRLSEGAFGRHASAGGACPRPRRSSQGIADGRTVLRPRRVDRRNAAHRPP